MQTKDLDLLKLQTKAMKQDPTVQGYSAALTEQLKQIADDVLTTLIYSNIDHLPEEVLDVLALQFGADWYDSESNLATKRQAINDALLLSRIRGTPAAVERIIEIYFGDGRVQEWFEYGGTGTPFTFKIITSNQSATNERAAQLIRAVNGVKRASTRLESVIITEQTDNHLYFAGILHTGEFQTIDTLMPSFDDAQLIDTNRLIDDTKIFDDQDGIEVLFSYLFGLKIHYV